MMGSFVLPLADFNFSGPMIESLGWTLFHFVWQALVVAIVAAAFLRLIPSSQSDNRYSVACLGLMFMLLCPLVTFAMCYNNAPHQQSRLATLERSTPSSTVTPPVKSTEFNLSPGEVSIPIPPPANTEQNLQAGNIPAVDPLPTAVSATSLTADRTAMMEKVQSQIELLTPWLVLAWVGGVVFLSLRMMIGWFRIQGIVRSGRQVSTELAQQCQNISRQLGIGSVVRLLESSRVAVPSVLGFFKPVILLPASTVTGLSNDTLLAILAHELAHVRRADFLVNLIQSVVEILLFYHPAVWWLASRVRAERENCCDDLASGLCGGPHPYATALLQLEVLRAKPDLSIAATDGDLVSRISRLVGRKNAVQQHRPLWLAAASTLLIAGITITSLIAGHVPASSANEPESNPAATGDNGLPIQEQESAHEKTLVVTAIGPDGQPLPGVLIHAEIWGGSTTRPDLTIDPNQMLYTDEMGKVTVKLQKEYYSVQLWANADGYVPLTASWESEDFANGDRLPAEFTFELEKGIEIGGVVVNEKGEPIAGASLQISASATHSGGKRPAYNPELTSDDVSVTTDEKGCWILKNAPEADSLEIAVLLSHPDYLSDSESNSYQSMQGIETTMLRDKSARLVMSQGVTVTGSITMPDGSPVNNGLVVWGVSPQWDEGTQETRIVNGTFATAPLPPRPIRITVMAPGWSPQTRIVEVHPMMETIDFEMLPGKTLSILIVDPDNNPIPGAHVSLDGWRSVRSIYNGPDSDALDSKIPFRTDINGMFRWTWAPDDEITFSVFMPTYNHKSDLRLTASDSIHCVKLSRPGGIAGTVIDQTTRKRIDDVSVFPVVVTSYRDRRERIYELRTDAVITTNGEFQIPLGRQSSQPNEMYRLRFEALGYAPRESEPFDPENAPAQLEYELEPKPWPAGRIVDPAGHPVKDAVIQLASGRTALSIRSFIVPSAGSGSGYVTQSAEDGTFHVPPMTEPFTLIAAQKDGIAEVVYKPGDSLGDLQLQAWAKVEGHAFDVTGKPASGLTIVANPIRYQYGFSNHIQKYEAATTDNTGYYCFERLPPMRYSMRTSWNEGGLGNNDCSVPVMPAPGETTTVDIGKGILVKGQINVLGSTLPVDYNLLHVLLAQDSPPPFGLPEELEALGVNDWRDGWNGIKQISDAGDYQKSSPLYSSVPHQTIGLNADGSFLLRIAESGAYDMVISAQGQHPDSAGVEFGLLAEQTRRFSVEELPDSETPIDLGVIEVTAYPVLNIGDELPNIVLTKNKGQTLELKSLRDKTVMLDFWSPYCEVCNADKQRLTEFAKELEESGNADTTKILSIESPGGRQYTRAPNDDSAVWLSGLLKDMNKHPELDKLGIYSLPRYLIVDEQGRLLYHGNLDGAIEILNK